MNKKIKIISIILVIVSLFIVTVIICYNKFFNKVNSSKTITKEVTTKETTLSESVSITKGGEYSFTGNINDGSITVNTDDDVTIKLNNVTITNSNGAAINVINAKNVYLIIEGENTLTGTVNEEEDSCIYSKDDLEIEGSGTLTINSNLDGITSKDDLVIKSGTYIINTDDDGIKGKDSVTVEGGTFTINSKGDGIKATNDEDIKKGIITINGGDFTITAEKDGFDSSNIITINDGTITINSSDDGMHADGMLEINKGTLTITAVEGLEATYIKINDGEININASDDGINVASKSSNYQVLCEINGGTITIKMGQGDTDGIDSNGDIVINGGTIDITGNSPFDYDGTATYNGGKLIVNGEEINEITNQFIGGPGGTQGGMPDNMPQDMQGGFDRRR